MVRDNSHQNPVGRRDYVKAIGSLSAITATGLAGCLGNNETDRGGSGGGSNYDRVYATVQTLKNDYWGAYEGGFQAASETWGLKHTIEANDANTTKMVSQIDSAFTRGTDAVVGMATGPSGVRTLAQKAVGANAPLITNWSMAKWYTPLDAGPAFVQFNIPEPVQTAALTARILFEEMGGSGNFVHITGLLGSVGAGGRNMGVEKAMEEYPDINRLGEPLPGDFTREKSREAMQSFVSKFSNKIEGVYAQNDAEALGALTICRENNLNVPIVGYDGVQAAVEEIDNQPEGESRIIGTFTANPQWQAGWSVAKTYDWLNGWRPSVPERMMFTGGSLIVDDPSKWKDKLDYDRFVKPKRYIDAVFGSGSAPYDWKKMSVVEAGEDSWDPQNTLTPVRKSDLNQLLWTDKNKPSGYSLPEEYDNSGKFDKIEKTYANHFQARPFE